MTDNFSIDENKVEGYSRYVDSRKTPFLTRIVQRIGLAKNEKQANKILIIISILFICGALVFFLLSVRQPEIKVIKIKARPVLREDVLPEKQSANTSVNTGANVSVKTNTQNAVLKK